MMGAAASILASHRRYSEARRASGRAQIAHVMANSGMAWYLFVAPAIHIARFRGVPVIVNYRGGLAAEFLKEHAGSVLWSLRRALGPAAA